MEPIPFKGHNREFGKGQSEYRTLPAYCEEDPAKTVVTCWSLTEEEMMEILQTGRVWFSQLTYGNPLQPILPSIDTPDCIKRIR